MAHNIVEVSTLNLSGVGTVGIELARSLKRALWYQSERYTDIYIVNVITLIVISP